MPDRSDDREPRTQDNVDSGRPWGTEHAPQGRRAILTGVATASAVLAASVFEASAAAAQSTVSQASPHDDQPEQAKIVNIIVRERIARDGHRWEEMAAYWHSDSIVEVSWFNGNGLQFVEQTKRMVRPDAMNFHQLSPAAADIRGERAIVDMPVVLQSFSQLNGIDVNQVGHAHLLWRAQRAGGKWLIAGLHAYYVRDSLIACNPSRVPELDDAKLAGFRPSYRYLSYILDSLGGRVRHDLPGVDRPETVDALRAAEQAWLKV